MACSPCAICYFGDDVGGLQHCDGCNRAFHHDGSCALKFLGKPFEKMAGNIVCVKCSRKEAREEVERSVVILRSVLAYREVNERQRHD